jgi:excisionase family DNA binding protein
MTTGPHAPAPTLTVLEVAHRLNVQPAVVRRWIAEGRIEAVRSGKGHRVALSEVERVKEEQGG